MRNHISRGLLVSGLLAVLLLTGCTGQAKPPEPSAIRTVVPEPAPATAAAAEQSPAPGPQAKIGLAPGDLAPNILVTDVHDGKRVELRQLKGKVVLLNFWATTCPPCKAEMPDLERLQQAQQENLVVLAVGKEDPSRMRAFAQQYGLTFQMAYDYGQSFGQYRITAVPTSYFVDQNGIISSVRLGAMKLETMQAEFARAQSQGKKP